MKSLIVVNGINRGHLIRDVSVTMKHNQSDPQTNVTLEIAGENNSEIATPESHQGKPADYRQLLEESLECETKLRQSLLRYEKMLDEIEDTFMETDLKGNITFVNETVARRFGLTKDQAIGLNVKSWTDPKNKKIVFDTYAKVYKTGKPCRFSYEIIRRDGTRRVYEDSGSVLRNSKGDIVGFRSISRDITERKKVEKELAEHRSRLEAIFGSVKEAIITVDMSLSVLEANQSTENICGIEDREMIGKPLSECLTRCSQSCVRVMKETLEKKSTIREYRIECNHHQRPRQLVSVTSAPLKNAQSQYLGAILVIRDITLNQDVERELRERHQFQNIIGRSRKMQELYRLLEDLANLETTVLITGESGTGKELVAKALHYSGQRAFKPFIAVNCSALTESLLESELFGHVKGAFTGAIKDKIGRFQAADGGTILLDEIGDISTIIQLKLLRVIQEKTFERVGDSESCKVDVRVIACTNKNLSEKVLLGEFREDLYYRLKVVDVALPPLRDRKEDIPLFIDHFCQIFNERFNKKIDGVTTEVLNFFMNYPWPGNVRELEHVIEHTFIICQGRTITIKDLPSEFRSARTVPDIRQATHLETCKIIDTLNNVYWNKTKAARLLGIDRKTLYRKMRLFKIGPFT